MTLIFFCLDMCLVILTDRVPGSDEQTFLKGIGRVFPIGMYLYLSILQLMHIKNPRYLRLIRRIPYQCPSERHPAIVAWVDHSASADRSLWKLIASAFISPIWLSRTKDPSFELYPYLLDDNYQFQVYQRNIKKEILDNHPKRQDYTQPVIRSTDSENRQIYRK
ncbi:hypothetical protein BDV33DRAFT_165130 [Aspergillus novoparasiticus]|uniref:Uncharacterized protein n=1 Tax=Aspergillus novoparasiticus TaxID=986946 RepID=A0A5N6F6I7_9EURO|nr:hypothetical protein BDV33DRAFT_165130 [Aspergillus novoparasiticus]